MLYLVNNLGPKQVAVIQRQFPVIPLSRKNRPAPGGFFCSGALLVLSGLALFGKIADNNNLVLLGVPHHAAIPVLKRREQRVSSVIFGRVF